MKPVKGYERKHMGKILHLGVADYFPGQIGGLDQSPELHRKTRASLNYKLLQLFKKDGKK